MVYVAFVIDAYSRRILGWRAATVDEDRAGPGRAGAGAVDPPPGRRPATWPGWFITPTPGRNTRRSPSPSGSPPPGVSGSVGTVGDAYDNALAESMIGLYKTELIKPRGPWRTADQVEIATLE